ncbi:MAG: type II toxin-antitoxin system RelE/ParE family toxin [Armatimonadota bacterium]
MRYTLRIRPLAEKDLQQAFSWYEDQRTGLGDDLILCVEAALNTISKTPLLFPTVHRQVRRALVRRFPYAIFYLIDGETIIVLAIFHCKRKPKRFFQE